MQAKGETLMKKLFWSSLILHIAAIAVTAAAFALLWTGLQDVENLLYTYETFLAAFAVGAVIYAADIVLLILIQKDKLTDIRKINSLFASLFGDLCLALGVISVFSLKTNAATILSAVTEGIIAANAVVRTVFAVKLKRSLNASESRQKEHKERLPLPAKEKRLSLAIALTGLGTIAFGIALLCTVFLISEPAAREEAIAHAQEQDTLGQLYSAVFYRLGIGFGCMFFLIFTGSHLLVVLYVSVFFFRHLHVKPHENLFVLSLTLTVFSCFSLLFGILLPISMPPHGAPLTMAACFTAATLANCVLNFIFAARIRRMQNVPPSETPLSQ